MSKVYSTIITSRLKSQKREKEEEEEEEEILPNLKDTFAPTRQEDSKERERESVCVFFKMKRMKREQCIHHDWST